MYLSSTVFSVLAPAPALQTPTMQATNQFLHVRVVSRCKLCRFAAPIDEEQGCLWEGGASVGGRSLNGREGPLWREELLLLWTLKIFYMNKNQRKALKERNNMKTHSKVSINL